MLNRSALSNRPAVRLASTGLVALACIFAVPWSVTAQTASSSLPAKPHAAKHATPKTAAKHAKARLAKRAKAAATAKAAASAPRALASPNAPVGLVMHGALAAPAAAFTIHPGAMAPAAPRALTGVPLMVPAMGHRTTSVAFAPPSPAAASPGTTTVSGTIGSSVATPNFQPPARSPISNTVPAAALGSWSSSGSLTTEPGHVEASGESITAHYRNANLMTVLTEVFDAAGVSYVISPDVTGTVTCSFKNMPLSIVIDSLLKGSRSDSVHREFTYEIERDVWYIRPKTS